MNVTTAPIKSMSVRIIGKSNRRVDTIMSPIVEEISNSVRTDIMIGTFLICVFVFFLFTIGRSYIENKIESTCQPQTEVSRLEVSIRGMLDTPPPLRIT